MTKFYFIIIIAVLAQITAAQPHYYNFPGSSGISNSFNPSDIHKIIKDNSKTVHPLIITSDQSRSSYTYDSSGNKLEQLIENPGGLSWVNYQKYSFSYDSGRNLLTSVDEKWINERWVYQNRSLYDYDSTSNLLSRILQKWEDSIWVNFSRVTYVYNNSGALLLALEEKWRGNVWVNYFKWTYIYNPSGYLFILLKEEWVGVWNNKSRFTFKYDTSGNILEKIEEKWFQNTWDYLFKSIFEYNHGKLISNSSFIWYEFWRPMNIFSYSYDDNGNMITELLEEWFNNTWTNHHLRTFTYVQTGNLIRELTELWVNGLWENYRKCLYSYDEYNNAVYGESFLWSGGEWISGTSFIRMYYNVRTDYLDILAKYVQIVYDNTTAVDDFPAKEKVYSLDNNYPNPFNPATTISYSLPQYSNVIIKIFDILGNEIETIVNESKPAGKYEVTFNAADLPSGTYFYQLRAVPHGRQAGSLIETKKMMLIK